jgi:hypothetical protein
MSEKPGGLDPSLFGPFTRLSVGWSRRTTLAVATCGSGLLLAAVVSWALSDGSNRSSAVTAGLILAAIVPAVMSGNSVLVNSHRWFDKPEDAGTAGRGEGEHPDE